MNDTVAIAMDSLRSVARFDTTDYAIFYLMLGVSVAIGLYFAYFGSETETVEDYLLGGKSMSAVPVAFSLIAGGICGITLIGVPSEVYSEGVSYVLTLPNILFVSIAANYIFLPIFFDLRITSIYEYLELRFNRRVRLITSSFYNTSYLLYLPAVVFVPSITLSQATGINIYVVSILLTFVCVFYTMIGGIKAVIWTDFIQLIAMFIAMFLIIVIGTINVGGIGRVFELSNEGNKLDIFNFDPDPFQRNSFWINTFGPILDNMITFCGCQATIQRFMSLSSPKESLKTLYIYFFGGVGFVVISIFNGMLVYASYFGCDPIENNLVEKEDQIFPYYVLDKMGYVPALPGIFIAGIVGAALSSLSTGLNTTAGTIYEDFIKKDSISEKKGRFIIKAIIFAIGVFCVFSMFIFENIGKVLAASSAITSIVYTPVGVIFLLGMFFPWTNAVGALSGGIGCGLFTAWVAVGASVYGVNFGSVGIYPEGSNTCPNSTMEAAASMAKDYDDSDYVDEASIFPLYRLSFLMYGCAGVIIGCFVGLVVSFLTGATRPGDVDPRLISPPLRRFLPKSTKSFPRKDLEEMAHFVPREEETSKASKATPVIVVGGKCCPRPLK